MKALVLIQIIPVICRAFKTNTTKKMIVTSSNPINEQSAFVTTQMIGFKDSNKARKVYTLNHKLGSYAQILANQLRVWNGGAYMNESNTTNSIYIHTAKGIVRLSDHSQNPGRDPLNDTINIIVDENTTLQTIINTLGK